jgi:hypothetical protein
MGCLFLLAVATCLQPVSATRDSAVSGEIDTTSILVDKINPAVKEIDIQVIYLRVVANGSLSMLLWLPGRYGEAIRAPESQPVSYPWHELRLTSLPLKFLKVSTIGFLGMNDFPFERYEAELVLGFNASIVKWAEPRSSLSPDLEQLGIWNVSATIEKSPGPFSKWPGSEDIAKRLGLTSFLSLFVILQHPSSYRELMFLPTWGPIIFLAILCPTQILIRAKLRAEHHASIAIVAALGVLTLGFTVPVGEGAPPELTLPKALSFLLPVAYLIFVFVFLVSGRFRAAARETAATTMPDGESPGGDQKRKVISEGLAPLPSRIARGPTTESDEMTRTPAPDLSHLIAYSDKETCDELDHDLKQGESQSLEFKERFPDQARDLAEVVASFATSNPGRIYLGVSKKGDIVGIKEVASLTDAPAKDEYQRRIEGTTGKINPRVRVKVTFMEKESKIGVKIDVPKGIDPIYYVGNIPYLRDLTSSRPATPDEVKEFHSRSLATSKPAKKLDEIGSYVSWLLALASDIELTLITYKDYLINPDLIQLLSDIHMYAELVFGLSSVEPATRLGIVQQLLSLAQRLDELAVHEFDVSVESAQAFGRKAGECLKVLGQLQEILNASAKIESPDAYVRTVRSSLLSLQNDWKARERRFKFGDVVILKEAFRHHAFALYRLSVLPEAKQLSLKEDLSELGRTLRELSSTEKYFGWWWSSEMRGRIEERYSVCETIISRIMGKIS